MFLNIRGKALQVMSGNDKEGALLSVGVKNSGTFQTWEIVYSDKEKKMRTSGLQEDFGFHIGRPFIMISETKYGAKAIEV